MPTGTETSPKEIVAVPIDRAAIVLWVKGCIWNLIAGRGLYNRMDALFAALGAALLWSVDQLRSASALGLRLFWLSADCSDRPLDYLSSK